MKLAVVHDYLISSGGGERVVLALLRNFDADLYTTQVEWDKTFSEFKKYKIYPHKLFTYPKRAVYQLEAIYKFRKMDLNDYDLVISSGNWAKQIALNNKIDLPIIHYEHTPIRVCYVDYWQKKRELNFFERQLFKAWVCIVSYLDQKATKEIDRILTNSINTRIRIQRVYGRTADVIHPPVDIKRFRYAKPADYFLSVQRIEPEKRIEIQLKAFEGLDEKLIIVGGVTGSKRYWEKLKKLKPNNVEFRGRVSDSELVELYSK